MSTGKRDVDVAPRPIAARAGRCAAVLIGVLALALAGASPALAGPWWRLSSRAAPTHLPPAGKGVILVVADNLGDAGVKGSTTPVTIIDTLPPGLKVAEPTATAIHPHEAHARQNEEANWSCSVTELRRVSCTTPLTVPSYETLQVEIAVEVDEPPGTVTSLRNEVNVQGGEGEGGGAVPAVSLVRPVTVSGAPTPFGVEEGGYTLTPENEGGSLDSKAGSHPFQLTSAVELNQSTEVGQRSVKEELIEVLLPSAPALSKSLSFDLPPGLLGNVTAAQRCSEVDFSALERGATNRCPAGSVVGVATVSANVPIPVGYITVSVPVFNLEPAPGEPARFGFEAEQVPVILDASVRTGGDYGVTVKVSNATEAGQVLGAQVTFWGQPGDPRHDQSRGWACIGAGAYKKHESETCEPPSPRSTTSFLTLPTSCSGQLSTSMEGESWTADHLSGEFTFQSSLGGPLERLEGCEGLPFSPSIGVQPEQPPEEGHPQENTSQASTPTGLNVDVKVAQQGTLEEGKLADADVKSTTVTLPEGMVLNPGAANGLEACSEAQVGYLGQGASDSLSPGAPEPLQFSTTAASCPEASKVGIVHIKTPLLNEELQGAVYLAAQDANPFGSLIALYIVAENPKLGVRVKLAGEGRLDERTGQISTTFTNTPQVPFEELKVEFFGGPRGPVSTPPLCGAYTTAASFTPWSGAPAVEALSQPGEFNITSGPAGSGCANPQPFAPSFLAGSTSVQAGALSPFTVQVTRPDGDQAVNGLSVRLPAGLAAILPSVKLCPEPQASQGECGPDSEIGHATISVGLGPDPYVQTGRVYITGPYDGAPFGLATVTPAVAGPFNLGNVVVRSTINVDTHTAAVTIASPLPTMVQGNGMPRSGIPVQLQRLYVTVDRPGFQFNPTNCTPTRTEAILSGSGGAQTVVSSPFQVANCSTLPFTPTLTASTQGQTSKANGASLTVRVTSTQGQANLAKTTLTLPKSLPARLTTLQKACLAATFEANPAGCPEGSVIGSGTAHTPVLNSPISGPAYLVSHGNAAFPDVEFVLQGEGTTLILDGLTDIKHGITTSTFNAIPDQPVTSFESTFPEGPHSVLAATGNLCTQPLTIPTTITGQNGDVINQNTKVTVTGCHGVKAYKATRAQQLAKAVAACRKTHKHNHAKRQACERQARKRYGARKAARHAARAGRRKTAP